MSRRCVVLVGMMGAGKSEVGEGLADNLGYDAIDTDALVVAKAGKSIARIFTEDGEDAFRALERDVIAGLRGRLSTVISVGGGAPVDPANREVLASLGHVIYLRASAQELYQRIKNDKSRPMLHVEDPKARMVELLKERDPVYRRADIVIDTEVLTVPEVVDTIIDELAKRTVETQSEL